MKKLEVLYVVIIVLLMVVGFMGFYIYDQNTRLLQSQLKQEQLLKERENDIQESKDKIDSLQRLNDIASVELKKLDILIRESRQRIDSLRDKSNVNKYENASVKEILDYWNRELEHIN